MLIREYIMHLRAGQYYGEESTCTRDWEGSTLKPKLQYGSEDTAVRAAAAMSAKNDRDLEAYPCAWCFEWHIGRKMEKAERDMFMPSPGEPLFQFAVTLRPADENADQGS